MIKRRILAWVLAGLLVAGGSAQVAAPDEATDASAVVSAMIADISSKSESALSNLPATFAPLQLPVSPATPPEETPDMPSEGGDEDDQPLPVPGGQIIIEVKPSHHDAPSGGVTYETDRQKLVAPLRQAMVNRQELLTLYYKTSSSDEMYEVANWLAEQAMQETGVANEGDYLRWHYAGWSCRITGSVSGGNYYLALNFQYSYYTTLAQEQEVTRRVNAAIDSFRFASTTSDYQKVRTIYEYLLSRMTYDYAHQGDESYTLQYSAYGALVNGTAVCQGYANILYRMLRECGVPCRLITGTGVSSAGRGSHAWNIVRLGGRWYDMDSTWDDAYQDAGLSARPYFLRGSSSFDGAHIRDENYTASTFNAAYPVSAQDYTPTSCDLNGHSWGAWVTDRAATYTAEGHQYRSCRNCGVRQEEAIPALPTLPATKENMTVLLRYMAGIEPVTDPSILSMMDINHDGKVNAADVAAMAQQMRSNPS